MDKLSKRLLERIPKPTDIPATGDELVLDGKTYKLVQVISAGTRDPNGYKVYRFRTDDGETIDVPMQGNKLVAEEKFVVDPNGIAASFAQAERDTAAHDRAVAAVLDAKSDGFVVVGPRRLGNLTKQTIAGYTFWASDKKDVHLTSGQLLNELGTLLIPVIGDAYYNS